MSRGLEVWVLLSSTSSGGALVWEPLFPSIAGSCTGLGGRFGGGGGRLLAGTAPSQSLGGQGFHGCRDLGPTPHWLEEMRAQPPGAVFHVVPVSLVLAPPAFLSSAQGRSGGASRAENGSRNSASYNWFAFFNGID